MQIATPRWRDFAPVGPKKAPNRARQVVDLHDCVLLGRVAMPPDIACGRGDVARIGEAAICGCSPMAHSSLLKAISIAPPLRVETGTSNASPMPLKARASLEKRIRFASEVNYPICRKN